MDKRMKKSKIKIIVGLFLLSVGILWILNSLGLFNYNIKSIFKSFFDLLPLLVIAVGFNMIFKRKKNYKTLVWLIFAFIIFVNSIFVNQEDFYLGSAYNKIYPYDDYKSESSYPATEAESFPFSYVSGKPYVVRANLYLGNGMLNTGVDTKDMFSYVATNAKVHIKDYNNSPEAFVNLDFTQTEADKLSSYSFYFADSISWDVNIYGAGLEGELNFSDINTKYLNIDSNIKKMDILLGEHIEKLKIMGNVEDTVIRIPLDKPYRIKASSFKNIKLTGVRFNENIKEYTSPNFNRNKEFIDIQIDGDIDSLRIRDSL